MGCGNRYETADTCPVGAEWAAFRVVGGFICVILYGACSAWIFFWPNGIVPFVVGAAAATAVFTAVQGWTALRLFDIVVWCVFVGVAAWALTGPVDPPLAMVGVTLWASGFALRFVGPLAFKQDLAHVPWERVMLLAVVLVALLETLLLALAAGLLAGSRYL